MICGRSCPQEHSQFRRPPKGCPWPLQAVAQLAGVTEFSQELRRLGLSASTHPGKYSSESVSSSYSDCWVAPSISSGGPSMVESKALRIVGSLSFAHPP